MAHVVMLCFPHVSHLKPMLTIAELLSHNGLRVTVLHSSDDYNYQLRQSPTNSNHNLNHRLRFMSMGPPLPHEKDEDGFHRFTKRKILDLAYKKKFEEIMVSLGQEDGDGGWSKPTCVIADYFLSSSIEVAEEHNIPFVAYCPNASAIWTYFHLPKLIELGQIPYSDDKIDKNVTCIPGMETFLRHRDLPIFFKFEPEEPTVQFFKNLATTIPRASALILNTIQELEAPIIDKLGSIYSKIYTIGPFEDHVRAFRTQEDSLLPPSLFRFRQENRSCLKWLDSQLPQSVIYASLGSIASLSHEQLLEIWYGLVNSRKPFLLVARADMIHDQRNEIQPDLTVGTKEGGFIVDWAPQEEVLKHPSVGGFLTHNGWKSTIESISAGVPMICWPQFADQHLNSRCVSHLWRIGLEMKDTCDRSTVEKMIRDLMEDKREEIMSAMTKYSKMARECVKEGGSSHGSLKMLVEDIKLNNLGY